MPSCAAVNCSNQQFKGTPQSFHLFPHSQPELLKQWVHNMNHEGFAPAKKSVVCSDHFEPSCFDRTGQTVRLRSGSVPTIFTLSDNIVKVVKSQKPPEDELKQVEATQNSQVSELCTPSASSSDEVAEKEHSYSIDPRSLKRKMNTHLEKTSEEVAEKEHSYATNHPISLERKMNARLGKTLSEKPDVPFKTSGDHFTNIAETLVKYQENDILCDAVLVAKCGRELKAHSALLAAVSPIFLVAIQEKPSSGPYHLCFPEVELEVLEIAVHFVYTGKLLLPPLYSQMNRLSKLFDKLSVLGLSSLRLHECEMTFVRSAKQPQYSSKSVTAEGAGNTLRRKDSVQKLQESGDWHVDKNPSSAGSFNKTMIVDVTKNDARMSKTRGNSVECCQNTLAKQRGHGDWEQERQRRKYKKTGSYGRKERMPGNYVISTGAIVTKPVIRPAYHIISSRLGNLSTPSSVLQLAGTSLHELNNFPVGLLIDQNFGKICTLYSDGVGIHETIDNVEPSRTTPQDILNLVGPSLTEESLGPKDIEKLVDKAGITSSQVLTCEHCKESNAETFTTEIDLLLHKIKHHFDQCKVCNYCGRRFSGRKNLMNHIKRHLGVYPQKNLKCIDCGLRFISPDRFKEHRLRHTGEKPHECPDCKKRFMFQRNMEQHQLIHTGYHPFLCELCGEGFMRKTALTKHMTVRHKFECAFCNCKQTSRADMQKHALEVHQLDRSVQFNSIIKNPRTCLCDLCGKSISVWSLREHMKRHCNKSVHCQTCGKTLTNSDGLRIHMRVHTGERPFVCSICQKGFACKSTLMTHLTIHSGIKPFECIICSKSFAGKGQLNQHMKQHTKHRTEHHTMDVDHKTLFTCKICNNQLSSKASLEVHHRIHTGERPYKCRICSRKFICLNSLTVHVRTHTGDKPYVCKECKMSFTQSQHLVGHMRTHTGEKPFVCKICNKSYRNKIDLRFHFIRLHKIDITSKSLSKNIDIGQTLGSVGCN